MTLHTQANFKKLYLQTTISDRNYINDNNDHDDVNYSCLLSTYNVCLCVYTTDDLLSALSISNLSMSLKIKYEFP